MSSSRSHPIRRVIRRIVVALVVISVILVVAPLAVVIFSSSGRIYETVDAAPDNDVAMVMGAAVWNGRPSPYLRARLAVALDLYRAGKVKVIIVSGSISDNEPETMRAYLLENGVKTSDIVLDEGGDDSYTSCAVAAKRFGVTKLTVISQDYHLPRTVTACRFQGIDAIGVGDTTQARDLLYRSYQVRELGANLKLLYHAIFDANLDVGQPTSEVTDALANHEG